LRTNARSPIQLTSALLADVIEEVRRNLQPEEDQTSSDESKRTNDKNTPRAKAGCRPGRKL
jgi:hypothetical protein